MKGRQWIATLAILVVGIVAVFLIMRPPAPAGGDHAHSEGENTHAEETSETDNRVVMDDEAAASSGIEIATAGPATIVSTLGLQGEIQFDQDRVAHVIPRLAGVVVKSVKNLGDTVKKGDLLAVIESQALADLKSEYLAAQTRLQLARTTFDREKRLWEEKISAEQDYLASRAALAEAEIALRTVGQKLLALGVSRASIGPATREQLTRFEIRAPIDGVVIEKHLALGEALGEEASIFVIADLSYVWAEMIVYPKDLAVIRLGQKVTVKATALNAEATGTISYVGPLLGEQTRSAKARATLKNPDQRWRPGLFVTVEVVQAEAKVPVAVSADAVQTLGDSQVVFFRSGGVFEARPVELGRSDGKQVEVTEGLAPGDRYAATASFVLKAELGKAGASHAH